MCGLGGAQMWECWFFTGFNNVFWRVKRALRTPTGPPTQRAGPSGRGKKWYFWLKMLCGYIQNCASYVGGEHIFRKFMKTSCRKVKHGAKIMSDTSKYNQNGVGNIKMSSKSCRIHYWSRPRKPPVAITHIFATFFEVQLGRHGRDKWGKERTTEQ